MTQQDGSYTISTDAPQGQNPILDMWGTLQDYRRIVRTFNQDDGSTRDSVSIAFDFTDIEVLDASEPYPYPITTINVPYSPPATSGKGTRWEALSKSLRNLMPDVPGTERLEQLKGKRQRWAQRAATIRVPLTDEEGNIRLNERGRQIWGDGTAPAWQILEIEGVAAPEDLMPYIAGVADGKTEQQFYQALLSDPKITNRPDLVTVITDRQILNTLQLANLVSRDPEGVLHRA